MEVTTINGIKIDYEDTGVGNVLVLSHGLGSSKRDWDLQIPILFKKFRIIAPDFRAHGQSERKPKDFGVPVMTEDIFQLLTSIGIKKAVFVGFSMGGAVCFQMAYSHPDMVQKLIIINSGPDFKNPKASGVDILAERTIIIKKKGFTSLAETISKGMFPEDTQLQWQQDFQQRILDNDEDAYLNTFASLMEWGLDDKLSEISHPTLIIALDKDYTPIAYK